MKFLWAVALLCCGYAHADWIYEDSTDKMTGKSSRHAAIASVNSLALGFPYAGQNKGLLLVRQHPKHGLAVIFRVEKGQILCSNYRGCDINVRFDDGQPVRFSGTESADHSSEMVFINNESRFIAAATKAKRILVQVNMYQNGAPVLEFQTAKPLEWKPQPPRGK